MMETFIGTTHVSKLFSFHSFLVITALATDISLQTQEDTIPTQPAISNPV